MLHIPIINENKQWHCPLNNYYRNNKKWQIKLAPADQLSFCFSFFFNWIEQHWYMWRRVALARCPVLLRRSRSARPASSASGEQDVSASLLGSSLVIRLQWAPSVLTPACCQGQVRDDTGAGSQWLRQQATLWWSVTQTSKHWVDLAHQSLWSVRTATGAVWICRVALKGSSPMPAHGVKNKKKQKEKTGGLPQPAGHRARSGTRCSLLLWQQQN